jgi:hypothetical protein
MHLQLGEKVSGTVIFAILHREKAKKGFWEALFARLLPNDYFIYVLVTVRGTSLHCVHLPASTLYDYID